MAVTRSQVHLELSHHPAVDSASDDGVDDEVIIRLRKQIIRGQNPRQRDYLRQIMHNDINFGIGPAGTGKTYLAVACAIAALADNEVERILLVRPAVEAGEKLGFLPEILVRRLILTFARYSTPYTKCWDLIGLVS